MLFSGMLSKGKSDFVPPVIGGETFSECYSFAHSGAHSIKQAYTPQNKQYIIISFFADFFNYSTATASYTDTILVPFGGTGYVACFGLGMYRLTSPTTTNGLINYQTYFGASLLGGTQGFGGNNFQTSFDSGTGFAFTSYHGCNFNFTKNVHIYAVIENIENATRQRIWMNGVEYGKYNFSGTFTKPTLPLDITTNIYLSNASTGITGGTPSIKMSSLCIHTCDNADMPFDIFDSQAIYDAFVGADGKPITPRFAPNIFINQEPGDPTINQVNGQAVTFSNCSYTPLVAEEMNVKYAGSYYDFSSYYALHVSPSVPIPPVHCFMFSHLPQPNNQSILYIRNSSTNNILFVIENTTTRMTSDANPSASLHTNYRKDTTQSVSNIINTGYFYTQDETLATSNLYLNGQVTSVNSTTYQDGILYTIPNINFVGIFTIIYKGTAAGVPWTDGVAMESYFLNPDGTLKDGGVDGRNFIPEEKPLLMIDPRYGFAQCMMSYDKTAFPSDVSTAAIELTVNGAINNVAIQHLSTGVEFVKGGTPPPT